MPLSPHIQNRIRTALNDCSFLGNDALLLTVFGDARLAPWRKNVPQTYDVTSRVALLMSNLMGKWNTQRENALVMFLCALGEQTGDPVFAELAEEARKNLIQEQIATIEHELRILASQARQGWVDPEHVARRQEELQEELDAWQAEMIKSAPGKVERQTQPPTVAAPESIPTSHKRISTSPESYTDLEIHILGTAATGRYSVRAKVNNATFFSGILQMGEAERRRLQILQDPQTYGLALYDALFTGDIARAYTDALAHAQAKNEGRLRLRLWIDHEAAELHALAWERLHDRREGGAFRIATDAKCPFSRYFGLQRAAPAPIEGQARMLCVIANPHNLDDHALSPLDVDAEVVNLKRALDGLRKDGVAVAVMPGQSGVSDKRLRELRDAGYDVLSGPSTLGAIFEQLAYAPGYHLLHIVGHGAFEVRRSQAALVLEDSQGQAVLISDQDLAGRLAGLERKPHLIFMAACKSASRADGSAGLFVGMAPRLVQAGIPAVVAMQGFADIEQTQTLTHHFYRFLLQHGIVDKALNQARGFLVGGNGWDMPVLFMRLQEGQLF